jgi:hypothetical protein
MEIVMISHAAAAAVVVVVVVVVGCTDSQPTHTSD